METKAKLRRLRMSPRKVRLVIGMVRGMNAQEAVMQLLHSKKRAAVPVKKLIESAMANAKHNHNMLPETLVIKTAFVDEGKTMYRWMPRAFGRATPLRKRTSHVTIVLEGKAETAKAEKKAKAKAEKTADAPKEDTSKNA